MFDKVSQFVLHTRIVERENEQGVEHNTCAYGPLCERTKRGSSHTKREERVVFAFGNVEEIGYLSHDRAIG